MSKETKDLNNQITEDYCSFEVSKLLKEKGFECTCNGYYNIKMVPYKAYSTTQHRNTTLMPTHALAIKWVRGNFGYDIWAYRVGLISFCYGIGRNGDYSSKIKSENQFKSYEDAISAALLYTLKNLIQ